MKNLQWCLAVSVGIFLFCSASPAQNEETESAPDLDSERLEARVVRVISGNRIIVDSLKMPSMQVEFLGIETPDIDDPNPEMQTIAKKVRKYTKNLLENQLVLLEMEELQPDAYGRLQAYVFVDKTFVNADLVRQGLARVADKKVQLTDFLLKKQQLAQEEKLGLWGLENLQTSQSDRKLGENPAHTAEDHYVASQHSKIYHRPDCDWAKKIASHNLVRFRTKGEATASGRRPCKICVP
jgi:micrococcal nuclease